MIALVLWFLAAFGFAFAVGYGKISLPLRTMLGGVPAGATEPVIEPMFGRTGVWLAALMECPACLGFWLGFGAGICGFETPFHVRFGVLVLAFATSGSNLLLSKIVGLI